jgi:hypothetical protein
MPQPLAEPVRGREERLEKIHILFFFLFHGLPTKLLFFFGKELKTF